MTAGEHGGTLVLVTDAGISEARLLGVNVDAPSDKVNSGRIECSPSEQTLHSSGPSGSGLIPPSLFFLFLLNGLIPKARTVMNRVRLPLSCFVSNYHQQRMEDDDDNWYM